MDIQERAHQRFAALRDSALNPATCLNARAQAPGGWCVSAIARLMLNAPQALEPVAYLQDQIGEVSALYLYPQDSLHISLLGCTQREDKRQSLTPRTSLIQTAVSQVLTDYEPVAMRLGRLNVMGNQFFVEVTITDTTWPQLRKDLATMLNAIGESPITYADPEPIHLNIARITSEPDRDKLREVLTNEALRIDMPIMIHTVELVVTDFVVTPDTLNVLSRYAF